MLFKRVSFKNIHTIKKPNRQQVYSLQTLSLLFYFIFLKTKTKLFILIDMK